MFPYLPFLFHNITKNTQAGGQLGKFIVEELLRGGKHKVRALTRPDSTNKIPDGVEIKHIDYNDQSSLVAALEGQDALIITMSVMAPRDQHAKLVEAAAAANVPWILPNEWGGDEGTEAFNADTIIPAQKKVVQKQIEDLGKSSWIAIACSFWYEYSLAGGVDRYGFDLVNRTVTFFDDGKTSINTSTWPRTGRGVAKVLGLKILPDDENDTSLTLDKYRNNYVRLSSFYLNQKEMFESVLRASGTEEKDWKVTYVPVKKWFEDGREDMQKGNYLAFARVLYGRAFFPGDNPAKYGATKELDDEKLGLPEEDLDSWTKVALNMAKDGYFNQ